MAQHHHIGTPTESDDDEAEYEMVPNEDGRVFYVSSAGISKWTLPRVPVGSTSLFEASLNGDFEFIRRYDNLGGNLNVTAHNGLSCMHYAVAGNRFDICQFLERKLDRPHNPDSDGVTPLALACRYGHSKIARFLVSCGAMIPALCKQGNTCLHEAGMYAQNHVVKWLLDLMTSDRNKPLFGHLIWSKNIRNETPYDASLPNPDTAALILSYMRLNTTL